MNIQNIKGLKYPDEAVIKFFFKEGLQNSKGKVIEFGCSNGNNLSLYYQYDYDVIGIDLDSGSIDNAHYNFKHIFNSSSKYTFHTHDMNTFATTQKNILADIFTIPNVISYISKENFIHFLQSASENKLYKKDASFFLRTRTIKDYRFGLGKKVSNNSYLLDNNITGEKGALCTCYQEYELIEILKKHLNLHDFEINHLDNQNLQNGETILNSDISIWGKIG